MWEGVANLSMWLCGLCGVEGDAKVWSQIYIPEGIECHFEVL